jgi:predicted DNA-binding transcriptional regulator AlpA
MNDKTTQEASGPVLLKALDVCRLCSIGRATLFRWMALGKFPPPMRKGKRWARWRADEVRLWVEGKWVKLT